MINQNMMPIFNKISDLFKAKVYVDSGPLEQEEPTIKFKQQIKKEDTPTESNNDKQKSSTHREESSNLTYKHHEGNSEFEKEATDINKYTNGLNANNTNISNVPGILCDLKTEFSIPLWDDILDYEPNLILRIDDYDYEGAAIITNYKLSFLPNKESLKVCLKNPFASHPLDYFDIPLFFINKIEKNADKKNYNNYVLEIQTKDNRNIKLVLDNNSRKFYGTLVTIINPKESSGYLHAAMKYREHHPVNYDGWTIYDPVKEFQRQGVILDNEDMNISYKNSDAPSGYRISLANKNFELCHTYPEIFLVPKKITDEDLREASTFRTKGRIPVLCYYNKENNVSLWRSSQTRSGLTYQRNEKDEKLVHGIIDLMYKKNNNNINNNPNLTKKLIIYDARPYLNALANRFKGAGFENTDNYKNTEIRFCEIDNIHCVRNAYIKLSTLINNPKFLDNKNFFSQLEQTTWYNFIYQIVKTSVEIATSLKSGHSVLIHCSDGWDRSSQLTALSQLLIEPYYRTIEGLIILIEKEWLSFGHQFRFRNGFYNVKDHSEDERAPIFLQWLDCIHQLILQFPHMFEFNNQLLVFIAYHLNSCQYGTFLFNSEYDRVEKFAKNKTVSIWTDVMENFESFVNPFYGYCQSEVVKYLLPNFPFHKICLWEEYYLKYLHFNNNFGKYYTINVNISDVKYKERNIVKDASDRKKNKMKVKIKTNHQYIELQKLYDKKIIKEQSKEIDKLNLIIKEITLKVLSKSTASEINRLSEDSKMFLADITKSEAVDEDEFVIIRNSQIFLLNSENNK